MSQTVDTRTPEFRNCLSVWPKEAQMCDCVYCKHVCVCVDEDGGCRGWDGCVVYPVSQFTVF